MGGDDPAHEGSDLGWLVVTKFDVHDPKTLRASRSKWQRVAHAALLERQHALALVHRRDAQLKALEVGVHVALDWALAQVAHKVGEVPAGSNCGPLVDQWNRAAGVAPGPAAYWCQSFADAVLVHGGGPQLHSGYTPAVVEWARAGKYGLRLVGHTYGAAQAGDFVYFKFPGTSRDFCDHVGVRLASKQPGTVEGNTSPGRGGSQNNGGVVAIHGAERIPYVVAVVRPPYKH